MNYDDDFYLGIDYLPELYIQHEGTKRHSGRYPWGSGDRPFQTSGDFMSRVKELRNAGMHDPEIAKAVSLESTTDLRIYYSIAVNERKADLQKRARELAEQGLSRPQIAAEMGYKNESSIRSLLNEKSVENRSAAKNTADFLRDQIKEKGVIDVGGGVEYELNISRTKLDQAISMLEEEGYPVYKRSVHQVTNKDQTTHLELLCPKGTKHADIYDPNTTINSVKDYISKDDGLTYEPAFKYPSSIDSKRVMIRYSEDGGLSKDGCVEIRRGVKDLSLGNDRYAQVRILVDGDRYIKGMAVYNDNDADFPPGVDVIFNTNKSRSVPKRDVLKTIKDDPKNPFGALIKEHGGQTTYTDTDGTEKLNAINKTRGEGDWTDWANKVPSQFLSKQPHKLAQRQLGIELDKMQKEYDEIMSLTNPTVKKKLLKEFASQCDTDAVHLSAAAFPRQQYHVILPFNAVGDDEVYAPNYKNGEKVALIRFPHGGTFEIPILTVNNNIKDCKDVLGTDAGDVIGINHKNADRLSGADFDGDTAMVIPTGKDYNIRSTKQLKGLEGFDPKEKYPYREGMKVLTKEATGNEMGKISKLISDMTLLGADDDELAKAVRHSMVVIDAAKHKLDYKQSEVDNDIKHLKEKWQGHIGPDGKYHQGSATLISRSTSPVVRDVKRVGTPRINQKGKPWYDPNRPEGALIYKEVTESYINKDGKEVFRNTTNKRLELTDDARTLISDRRTQMEEIYADYSNKMKSFANQARLSLATTKDNRKMPSAAEKYAKEVQTLNDKLLATELNRPRERMAQIMVNQYMKALAQDNPGMDKKEYKKKAQTQLVEARELVGAKRQTIEITPKEWEAIQAGAVSANVLSKILDKSDMSIVRQYATPKKKTDFSTAQSTRIQALRDSGKTISEIADAMNVSVSTIKNYLTENR